MALGIQTAYCLIHNQKFDNAQLADSAFSFVHTLKEGYSEGVGVSDIYELIRKYNTQLKQADISGCVCVLLPHISDHEVLKNITKELSAILGKVSSLEIYLYPYGEPSFLMALARIKRETQVPRTVWVLALNVKNRDEVNSHDSLVLAYCKEQSPGLTMDSVRIDLDKVKQSIAVEKVVKQLGVGCKKQLSDLSFTIDGQEPIWLNYISHLSPWITTSTQYQFANFKFGSLGACSGLLKAINLFDQQIAKPKSIYQSLQLDIEPNGYVAGTLFGWSNE